MVRSCGRWERSFRERRVRVAIQGLVARERASGRLPLRHRPADGNSPMESRRLAGTKRSPLTPPAEGRDWALEPTLRRAPTGPRTPYQPTALMDVGVSTLKAGKELFRTKQTSERCVNGSVPAVAISRDGSRLLACTRNLGFCYLMPRMASSSQNRAREA